MKLRDTKWLADLLGISVSTVEKLRAEKSDDVPEAIVINRSVRYSEHYVNWWLQKRMAPNMPDYETWCCKFKTNVVCDNSSFSTNTRSPLKLKRRGINSNRV